MPKIKVEVCIGTACHLLGAPFLIEYLEELPPFIRKRLEITYAACLKQCDLGPRIKINGINLMQATPEKVAEMINTILNTEGRFKKWV